MTVKHFSNKRKRRTDGETSSLDRRPVQRSRTSEKYRRDIISFSHIYICRSRTSANAWNCWTACRPFSLFPLPLLTPDGTPRLRGKFDIFRHGIWRSNDARAKLSTSICLFVPNWPSTTPGWSLRRNWKVSFCSSTRFIPLALQSS